MRSTIRTTIAHAMNKNIFSHGDEAISTVSKKSSFEPPLRSVLQWKHMTISSCDEEDSHASKKGQVCLFEKYRNGLLINVFYNRNDALIRNWGVQVKEKVVGGGLRRGPSSIQIEFKESRWVKAERGFLLSWVLYSFWGRIWWWLNVPGEIHWQGESLKRHFMSKHDFSLAVISLHWPGILWGLQHLHSVPNV